ncbi:MULTISPECIES: hypothetical protein [Bradyrhizobium]|uniref:hypothetical protein n=1 Tax=Bradyrhizobium TaxID=374 RepID=UPI0020136F83|nr:MULTISPECIES: hypothetical protein [Bradyrhizobium]
MDEDLVFEMRRREELRLIRAFLGITDPSKRQRILKLTEQLADEAIPDAAGLAFASPETSLGEAPEDIAGRPE